MFDAFEQTTRRKHPARTLAVTVLSLGVYGTLGFLALSAGRAALEDETEVETEIHFEPPAPATAPPPPPPTAAPAPPPAVTPPPPAPRRAIAVPRKMPQAPPPEADPSQITTDAPTGDAVIGGPPAAAAPAPAAITATAPPPEPAPRPRAAAHAPIQITEGVTPPEAAADNAQPAYPEEARAAGKEGVVVLKFVVTARGTVEQIHVLKGEPPFVEAALAAVKTWRFIRPALLDGSPVSVYRVVPLRFKLR